MTTTPDAGLPGQTPPSPDPQGQTPRTQGQTPNPSGQTSGGSQKTPIDSLPPDVQEFIARLRDEAEQANKAKKAAARERQLAEEAKLAEQGQFKELAAKHETRVKELESVATSYSKLAEQINAQIEAEIADWPIEVKSLVPGVDVPAEQRLEQLARLRPLLDKLQVQARGTLAGNRPNPPQAQPAATKAAQNDVNRRSFAQQRNYRI